MKLPIDKLPKSFQKAIDWLKAVIDEYNGDNGAFVAAAMSFYTFISLVPLALLAVAIIGFVLGSQEQSKQLVFDNVRKALPGPIAGNIQGLIDGVIKGRTSAGIIGLLLLLWSGSSVFVNFGRAMNIAWDSEPTRGFIKDRLVALVTLLAAGLLLVVSFGLTTVANLLQGQQIFGYNLDKIPFVWQIVAYVIPPLVSIALFTLIYKILPTANVSWKAALVGGATAGIIWEILKIAFTWYLTHFANYGEVYGSLATIIILVLWIFYSSMIAVLGAEVSQVYGRRVEQRR